MKCKLLILLLSFFILGCTSASVPPYNPQEFETSNYQKNVDNAVDAADLLSDFDQSKIPSSNIDTADISNLVQADLYYNQGEYGKAFGFYNTLALKYKDPRIIYKAIICLEHVSITPEQTKSLNDLVTLFIQTDPNSKLAKLFQIKMAINNHNLTIAENNLDDLMQNNASNGRVILLFISSMISNDITESSYRTLDKFASYVAKKYADYPEAHLVAILAYSVSNNSDSLSTQVKVIHTNYPNWTIPLYWSLDILVRHKHIDTLIKVLEPIVATSGTDKVLQNVYVAALMNSSQKDKAVMYLNSQLNGINRDNALLDLGVLYAKNNEYDKSLSYFNQANVKESALNEVLALVKGSIYDYQNKTDMAIAQYKLVTQPPLVSITNIMLLNAFLTQGNYQMVDTMLNKFAKDAKMNEEQTILFKSSYYLGEGKYQIGYDLIKSKLNIYGKDSDYLYQYAALSGMMNYTKQSIELYKKYIKQNPNQAFGYNDLAFIFADQTNDYKQAKKYADEAYRLAPSDPNVLDTLGWVYYKMGNYSKALPYIKTSYEVNYDIESAKHLAAVYLALNRQDLAKNVIITDKATLQKQLKQQLIKRSVTLLSYIQFGVEIKQ